MTQELFIPIRFPSLNEYIGAMNRNRFVGNQMKREHTDLVAQYARVNKLGHFTEPVTIEFHYTEPNNKRDGDNIVFAKKFILDGLVEAGVLTDDSQKWVKGFTDSWNVTKIPHKVGVHILMKEVSDGGTPDPLDDVLS